MQQEKEDDLLGTFTHKWTHFFYRKEKSYAVLLVSVGEWISFRMPANLQNTFVWCWFFPQSSQLAVFLTHEIGILQNSKHTVSYFLILFRALYWASPLLCCVDKSATFKKKKKKKQIRGTASSAEQASPTWFPLTIGLQISSALNAKVK